VATVRSPESVIGSNYGDDRIEKPASFVDDVREPFVMGIGEIPLKGVGSTAWIGKTESNKR
jgi:hypothetical protein